ncbi:MAG: carbohydrate-binding domain-containing protein [Synergistaceae bacterium]|nr:carbohydrate-binding domain-containing protein [Synergistaceae bacterium]
MRKHFIHSSVRSVVSFFLLLFMSLFLMTCSGGCGGGSNAVNDGMSGAPDTSGLIVKGPGHSLADGEVILTEAGDYDVSGVLSDGCLVIDTSSQEVNVNLSGVTIANSSGPAIFAKSASLVRLILSEGTVNAVSDGGADADRDAAIFSSVPLEIGGGGSLVAVGNCQEGIASDSTLTISGGDIRVSAVDDGLNAGEGIVIDGGYLYVDAIGDGIDSNANLTINGGTVIAMGGPDNGGLDAGDGFRLLINGGLVIGTGDNNARADESSAQKVLSLNFGAAQPSGTTIHIADKQGAALVTYKTGRDCRGFIFSSPSLQSGVAYNVYTGGTSDGTERDGLYDTEASYTGGSKETYSSQSGGEEEDFILSGTVGEFNIGDTFGSGGGGPGGGPRPRF